jgi:threonine dehydrogenase-like Zn-dependent dehydrogenase
VAYGGEGTGHGETILVGRNLAARMPDGVAYQHACFATLGSIAMNAVRTARIELGDVVAVIGLGLVGQLVAQLVRLQGGVVVGIDLNGKRVEMARGLGADYGIAGASALEAVRGLTNGRGVDCAIVAAASKSPAPAQHALSLCRDRGRICIVGAVGMEFPWNDMYLKEIQLYMSRAYGPGSYDASYEKQGRDYPLPYVRWTENRNMEEFLRLIAAGRIDVRPLITHEFALDDAAPGGAVALSGGGPCGPRSSLRAGSQGGHAGAGPGQGRDRIRPGGRGQPGQMGAPAQPQETAGSGAARGVLGLRGARQELRVAFRRRLRLRRVRRGARGPAD